MDISVYTVAMLIAAAAAQGSPSPEPRSAPQQTWTASAGPETLSIRDVTRSGIPLETSPVSLEGTGLVTHLRYERRDDRRRHLLSGTAARIGGLSLETPATTLAAASGHANRIAAQYEYRRSFWRDGLLRDSSFEYGVLALADWQAVEWQVLPSGSVRVTDLETGVGGLAGVRLERWPRLTLATTWTMALVIGSTREVHELAGGEARRPGGGWQVGGEAEAAIRLGRQVWLTASYSSVGQARFASHRGQSDRWNRFVIGVRHVR